MVEALAGKRPYSGIRLWAIVFRIFRSISALNLRSMAFSLTGQDVETLSGLLGPAAESGPSSWFWNIRHEASGRVLALTISDNVALGSGATGIVVSAQTHQGYVELHDVVAMLPVEPDEVMFIARGESTFSSLVVGRTCTCSLFANIRADVVRADFSELDPVVLMAAAQLSLAESLLESSPDA
jgi:hypothetical protein